MRESHGNGFVRWLETLTVNSTSLNFVNPVRRNPRGFLTAKDHHSHDSRCFTIISYFRRQIPPERAHEEANNMLIQRAEAVVGYHHLSSAMKFGGSKSSLKLVT